MRGWQWCQLYHPLEEPRPRILYADRAFERMSGYTPVEVPGRTPRMRTTFIVCYDICDPKRLRRVAAVCEDFGVRLQFAHPLVYSAQEFPGSQEPGFIEAA